MVAVRGAILAKNSNQTQQEVPMSQLYFQQKRYLWEVSKSGVWGWVSLAAWVLFSVFNLGMVIGMFVKYLKP
jgi:hypothetical protein